MIGLHIFLLKVATSPEPKINTCFWNTQILVGCWNHHAIFLWLEATQINILSNRTRRWAGFKGLINFFKKLVLGPRSSSRAWNMLLAVSRPNDSHQLANAKDGRKKFVLNVAPSAARSAGRDWIFNCAVSHLSTAQYYGICICLRLLRNMLLGTSRDAAQSTWSIY